MLLGSALFPRKLEGLVVVVVGTVILSKYLKASNKVVLVRFGTCAGNHLYTLWLESKKRAG